MKLHEEFKEYETLWEDINLSENTKKAYSELMRVQRYIENIHNWEIIDCQQDDEYSMTLKCDIDNAKFDFEEAVSDIPRYSETRGVEASINSSNRSGYDVIIYLSYEG